MFQMIFSGSLSGKTSIKKVIFDKMPPYELELNKQKNKDYDNQLYSFGYCKLNIIEFPSSFNYINNFKECEQYLKKCNALIFIIDYNPVKESKIEQIDYFKNNILPILNKYPNISLYIFIHKIDNYNFNAILQSQYNEEIRQIQSQIEQQIYPKYEEDKFKNKLFITSIYNHTLIEAFSNILQNILPQNKNLCILLSKFGLKNTYIFDINNKFCLAKEIEMGKENENMFEICVNMIDFVMEMATIYDENEDKMIDSDDDNFDEDMEYQLEIKNLKNGIPDSKSIIAFYYIFKNLALIFIIKKDAFEKNKISIDANINILKQGIKKIFQK
jgi:hypothetical protein